MERYWVYLDSRVQGPVDVPVLRKLPGFNLLTQVCPESGQQWRMADNVMEIKSYFLSPPRVSSLPAEAFVGASAATLPGAAPKNPIGAPSVLEELPSDVMELKDESAVETSPETEPGDVEELAAEPAVGGPLRISCEQCGYKNPRDVGVCMKCATLIKKKPAGLPKLAATNPMAAVAQAMRELPTTTPLVAAPLTGAVSAASASLPAGTTVEIPVTKILAVVAGLFVIGASGIIARRVALRHGFKFPAFHSHKKAAVVPPSPPAVVEEPPVRKRVPRYHHYNHVIHSTAESLPGVSDAPQPSTDDTAASAPAEPTDEKPASYEIVSDATPLKHRQHAPADSPYTTKHRADKALWTEQQKQAILQAQHLRIYGGQRTILRNVEILMQILRDREYDTAFETGKRIYLYDDVDWDSVQMDGPAYEVRLTLSGGREADGTARKSLRFAFATDLERGTVEPGGSDQLRSNTLHAFFDESRIPPEERRDIARDTEELVQAAQPDASPLALDTVVRHFAATYGVDSMKRVAQAYGLRLVTKKIVHEPQLSSVSAEEMTPPLNDAGQTAMPAVARTSTKKERESVAAKPEKPIWVASKSGPVSYELQPVEGRERLVSAHAETHATPAHLFEIMSGYEHLKDFVPDILTSEREGQDGNAAIVHIVGLTRFMFFVYKINLHLRMIEHPQEHSIEFERIAGDFEQFRGALEIHQDSPNGPSTIHLHATIVPKGHMPDWILRAMAERFLVPVVDALRSHAENL